MVKPSFSFETAFFKTSLTAGQRVGALVLILLAGVALVYADGVTPYTLDLAPLGLLIIVAVQALLGLCGGIVAATIMAFAFRIVEHLGQAHHLSADTFVSALMLLAAYLLPVLLLDYLRRYAGALDDSRLRLKSLELSEARAELAVSAARYHAVGESLPFGVWHCNADGQVVHMSDSFLKLVGMDLAQVREGGWLSRVMTEDAERIRDAWRNRDGWGLVWEDEYRIRGADDKIYTILCRGHRVLDEAGRTVGWTGINLDITDRARSREQLAFLAEAGRVLSLSLDPSTTLERIARLAVPRLADWCGVDIIDDNGEVRSVAVLHADESKIGIARELRAYPQDPDENRGLRRVLRTGMSELYEDIPDSLLVEAVKDARQLELIRQIGMRSVMIVPLIAREKTLGAISFVTAESGRHYTKEDLAFAELLARRAALSFDNARMYAREQRVAGTLQSASLPTTLPQLPGIQLRATYLPGASESEIGGDWYDAFTLPDGCLALSIGDVAGKGLRAAVAMGSARQAIRATALEGSTPSRVLQRVNRVLIHEQIGMITAIFAILDPVTLQLRFASAGHPAALLALPGEKAERLAARGLPLGLFPDSTYEDTVLQLKAGSLLTFYTDGLIEFEHDVVKGEQILTEAVEAQAATETPNPAISILRRVILGVPKDDIAILTVAISAQPVEEIDITVDALPASARVLRQALRRLALSFGLSETQTFDMLVATGEAISNAIEHAYGVKEGTVRVRGFREDDALVIEVQDRGRWRPAQDSGRGRGLPLMRALMQTVTLENTKEGTLVRLVMPLVGEAHDRSSDVSYTRA